MKTSLFLRWACSLVLFLISYSILAQSSRTQDSLAIVDLSKEAFALSQAQKFKAALNLQYKGAAMAKASGFSRLYISLLRQAANTYSYANQLDTALHKAEVALQLSKELEGVPAANQARLMWIIGEIHSRQGQHQQAIEVFEHALATAQALQDTLLEIQGLTGLGTTYYIAGEVAKALEIMKRQEMYYLSRGEMAPLIPLYNNSAAIYADRGDYQEALSYMEQAKEILENQPHKYWLDIMRTYRNMALIHREMDQPYQAIEYLQLSNAIIKQHLNDNPDLLLGNLTVEASILQALDRPEASLKIIQREIYLHEAQPKANQNNRVLHDAYLNAAGLNINLKRYQAAEKWLQRLLEQEPAELTRGAAYKEYMRVAYHTKGLEAALSWANRAEQTISNTVGHRHPYLAEIHQYRAKWYRKAAYPTDTIVHYQERATQALIMNPNMDLSTAIGEQAYMEEDLMNRLLSLQADFWLSVYEKDQQPSHLERSSYYLALAKKVAEQSIGASQLGEDKRYLGALTERTYYQELRLQYLLQQQESNQLNLDAAFQAMENNKSILLANAVRGQQAQRLSGIPDSLLEQKKELQQQIDQLAQQQLSKSSANQQTTIALNLADLRQQLQTLQNGLLDNYPQYAQLVHQKSDLRLQRVQKGLLNERMALLEYWVGDSTVYLLVVTQESAQLYDLRLQKRQLDAYIEGLRVALTDYSNTQNMDASTALSNNGHWLYRHLLKTALEPLDQIDHLLIVTDYTLGHIPFEVLLVTPARPKQPLQSLDYLLQHYTVRYSYSTQLLLEQTPPATASKQGMRLFALASDYGEGEPNMLWQRSKKQQYWRSQLKPLPSAKEEVKRLSQLYPSGRFELGPQATERNFKEMAPTYDILHLAMHGLLNPNHPTLSSLAFTENHDTLEDNFLYAHEIAQLPLTAQLVVLSACETGYGQYKKGEGVMSLARSFMHAGVPSTVVSLWQVNDYATATIMELFYQKLREGIPTAEALTLAKRQYLKETHDVLAHPAYWAAFVAIGKNTVVAAPSRFWLLWLGAGALLLLGLGSYWFRKR